MIFVVDANNAHARRWTNRQSPLRDQTRHPQRPHRQRSALLDSAAADVHAYRADLGSALGRHWPADRN